jgi:hypothetical protein
MDVHGRGVALQVAGLGDFVALNRYYGWYLQQHLPGVGMAAAPFVLPPDLAEAALVADLTNCTAVFANKPLLLSEYGAADLGAPSRAVRSFSS